MSGKKSLAILRKENQMTQRDLAKILNVSSGAIGMYESGKRTPPLTRAIKIAQLFNVPVEYIDFEGSLEKKENSEKTKYIKKSCI